MRGKIGIYMQAYAEALAATSRAHAPSYTIPADYKPYMRVAVARIMVHPLSNLDMAYPECGRTARVAGNRTPATA